MYAPAYSPEFQPIEQLWNLSKREFRKRCLSAPDFKDIDQIKTLVEVSIRGADRAALANTVESCRKKMY